MTTHLDQSGRDAWPVYRARLAGWAQTGEAAIKDSQEATGLINQVGLATVYPVSTEIPDLFHAHVGDPAAKTEMKWDSASGRVYSWRWEIGRARGAFYGQVIRKRPTFVRWPLLPAVLSLFGDLRTADELYDFGVISPEAYRIARALDDSQAPLSTPELREAAGFPTGRESSNAYHKALDELATRLVITVEFGESGEGNKCHGIMHERFRDQVLIAASIGRSEALRQLLMAYLPCAAYALPSALSRQLHIPRSELTVALAELESEGIAAPAPCPGATDPAYVWTGSTTVVAVPDAVL